jgi:extracellular elastinolytic metalloproteinase
VASESAPSNWYHYAPDVTAAPTTQGNVNVACVNAFYIVNTMHDLSYRYGFTEVRIWSFGLHIEI